MPTFDPTQYKLDYTQFSTLSDNYLTNTYNYVAKPFYQFIFDYFTDVNQQYYWSEIVLSHVLTLINPTNSNLITAVGKLKETDTGDISVTLESLNGGYGSDWWCQTRYGAQVWALFQQNGISSFVGI
jgi:hypothetical protein